MKKFYKITFKIIIVACCWVNIGMAADNSAITSIDLPFNDQLTAISHQLAQPIEAGQIEQIKSQLTTIANQLRKKSLPLEAQLADLSFQYQSINQQTIPLQMQSQKIQIQLYKYYEKSMGFQLKQMDLYNQIQPYRTQQSKIQMLQKNLELMTQSNK